MNLIKNITNPLERRRIHFGYSQQDISKLLGITQSQYSRIEKGDTNPNKHLKKLSEIFGCKPNEIFQFSDALVDSLTSMIDREYKKKLN